LDTISANLSHGGVQDVYRHASTMSGTDLTFSLYVPAHAGGTWLPVVWFLSGLTCTHANVTEKGEFRRACAVLGLMFDIRHKSVDEAVLDDPNGVWCWANCWPCN